MMLLKPSSRTALALLTIFGVGLGCASRQGASAGEHAPEAEPDPADRTSISGEEIERTPTRSIEETLASRFPGVWVTRTPEGGISIRIRGATTIHGSKEPLFVIDGLPVNSGPGGSLFGINLHDIESIEVLKTAAATTMYGLRGANGVIVVKTKQPDR